MSKTDFEIFKYGSDWVRADFHLHTKADREFNYSGDGNYFVASYIASMKKAGIQLGVITNHNKFDRDEFRELRKAAQKEDVYILPGVEMSVDDGANGIHTLIIFSEEWLDAGGDYINQFLNVAFTGKIPDEYENANGRSSLNLINTIKTLEGFGKDFFLVFAHVEDKSGLWIELDGGRLKELGKNEFFLRRALAFQKVRTHDVPNRKCRLKVKDWLEHAYPAEVEGSDCKTIDEIGKGQSCYLKIGDFNFEAIKYAILDHSNRICLEPKKHERSHIRSASFEGGVLKGKTIYFSSGLNVLIGIRGSGKSSVLEAIRYALDIPFGEKSLDTKYKKELIQHTLGSGGKVTVEALDQRGQRYEIRRICGERPDVYVDGVLQPGVSIRETIVHKPTYFGQKDLSSTGEGFEKDLVEKLLGEKLRPIRTRIDEQRRKVTAAITQLKQLAGAAEKKKEYEAKKQDAEFRLQFYKDHGVEEKLQKQVDYEADSRKCSQTIGYVRKYLSDLSSFINTHEDDLKNQRVYTSRQNEAFFKEFFALYGKLITAFDKVRDVLAEGNSVLTELQVKVQGFETVRESLKEQFAEIERKLTGELKAEGKQAIRPDEFRKLRAIVDQSSQILEALTKQESQKAALSQELLRELAALNNLWHTEFQEIQAELDKVNKSHSSLVIKAEFKGDKTALNSFMKDTFRGSRIREATFSPLITDFSDFGAIYQGFDIVLGLVGNSAQAFEEYFNKNLTTLLTWQVPNRFIIEYRGRELRHHSLGQRASALILFVLSQQEHDLIIIDQPEDDLDNQTIYEDVIKLIRLLKPNTQFIFATHNANFPVLGDSEQIISCVYSDDAISIKAGSIDCPELQQEVVNIMEGGEEAFEQRKRIYEIWKPRNS